MISVQLMITVLFLMGIAFCLGGWAGDSNARKDVEIDVLRELVKQKVSAERLKQTISKG